MWRVCAIGSSIRELENVLERAIILSPGSTLTVEPLVNAVDPGVSVPQINGESIDDVTRTHVLKVLEESRWRIKGAGGAADRLGMKPSTLRYRMKKLGIRRP